MAFDLDRIKEKLLKSQTGKGAGSKDFLKMKVGDTVTLRVVPIKDGSDDPFKEYTLHYGIGQGGFLCPKKNFGETCPACDFASKLWAGAGEEDVEDKEMAKQLFPNQRYYSPVIVRGDEARGVVWWSYSKTVYEELLKLCLSEDYGDISNPDNGTDITVSVTQPKGKKYSQTSIQPRRMPSPLSEDAEEAEKWMNTFVPITSILSRKTTSEVQQALDSYLLTGVPAEDVSSSSEKYGAKKEEAKPEPKPEPKGKKASAKSEVDKAFDEVLD